MEVIKHANIIYMPTISPLGGIETYVYELVKKYNNLDIAVVSKRCDEKQYERIRKYCRVYIHTNQRIECKVAIINYDQGIIPFINQDAKIYQTIHADYTNPIYDRKPQHHTRVTAFIAITKYLQTRMADMLKPNKLILGYNPLTIEKEDKPIVIVSATRLHKHKGKDRMQKLASALDKANINYIWYVITNETTGLNSPNVIFIPNRLDISKFLAQATYVCLLSDSEACSYTLNEALYRNIPIITTPLPYLDEIGVVDGVNAYIMDFECNNVDEIVKKITNVPTFEFNHLPDIYNELFDNKKSTYREEMNMKVKVKCIMNYYDMETSERKVRSLTEPYEEPEKHPNRVEWITTRERAEHLVSKGLVEIIETIKEKEFDKAETKKVPTKKVETKKVVKKTK